MSLRSKLTKVTNLMIIISFYALTSVAQVEYLPSEEFYILLEGPLYLVPPRRSSVTFHEDWIPQKLMVEFQDRYDEKIGPIESSFVNKEFVPKGSFLLGLNSEYLQTFIQSEAIREHGVYMLSRSMEYRFDEYIKRNHHLKPVYFLKKRLTQREIDVGIDEKIKMK